MAPLHDAAGSIFFTKGLAQAAAVGWQTGSALVRARWIWRPDAPSFSDGTHPTLSWRDFTKSERIAASARSPAWPRTDPTFPDGQPIRPLGGECLGDPAALATATARG
jgi:hypothetical protein